MVKKVVFYSIGGSLYCDTVREFLEEHKIRFTEKRIDLDDKSAKELEKIVHGDGVPILVVDSKVYACIDLEELKRIFKVKK
ncbi:glutaredoxin family protein [Candidatus Woesearchaeota archaeon]|nr:glutaredoxin family protein [Candidatus Woesearchaeota archaeon]